MSRMPCVSMPGYTCGAIDSVISLMEELRSENDALRQWASYWEDKCSELESDIAETTAALESRIETLENEANAATE